MIVKVVTCVLLIGIIEGGSIGQQWPQNGLSAFAVWKNLEYVFPTTQDRSSAIAEHKYIIGNAVPIDTDVYYPSMGSPRVFITMPRFMEGTPITLGTVTTKQALKGPEIKAFPNYSSQSSHGQNCDGITSVFRIKIDECKRLWVLDTGKIGDTQHCQPQLLVYDLQTDALLSRYRFPKSQYMEASLFVTLAVDVRNPSPEGNCENTMVYVADVTGFGVVVYDHRRKTSWRITNKLFFPVPDFGTFTIERESFDLMDGVLGLAVSPLQAINAPPSSMIAFPINRQGAQPRTSRRERQLFFQSLASETLNAVPLSVVDNQTLWTANSAAVPRQFKSLGRRNTQSGPLAMDSKGSLYFGLVPTTLASWNTNNPSYSIANIRHLINNRDTLQFISGIKVIKNQQGLEELWMVSNRLQKFYAGSTNYEELNFRIQAIRIDQLPGAGQALILFS